MKKLLATLLLLGFVCQADAGTITRPTKTFGGTSFINGVVPDASDFNGDIDTIYSEFNGSISNANVSSTAAIVGSKISPAFTSTSSVTAAAPCTYLDESDQAADSRRWYLCSTSAAFTVMTRTDADVLQNTWVSISRTTGVVALAGVSPLEFEGATADAFETQIQVTDPTADRTWTLPNATDTFVGRDTTDTLTNKTLTTPVINTSISGTAIATQAQMETATDTGIFVTPGREQYHPGVAKMWAYVENTAGTPSTKVAYNVASYTDNGVGDITVNLTTGFSSASAACVSNVATDIVGFSLITSTATTAVRVETRLRTDGTNADSDFMVVCYGDQ